MTELHVDLSNIQTIKVSENLDVDVVDNELHIHSLINSEVIDENFNQLEQRVHVCESRLRNIEERMGRWSSNLGNLDRDR